MKRQKNLIPTSERSKSEVREIGRKGGKASGKARRERKQLKEELIALLQTIVPCEDGTTKTAQERISLAILEEATKGNVKAFKVIRDTIGEKPKDTHTIESDTVSSIKLAFVDKSGRNKKPEKDPKIVGEYTPPSNIDDG